MCCIPFHITRETWCGKPLETHFWKSRLIDVVIHPSVLLWYPPHVCFGIGRCFSSSRSIGGKLRGSILDQPRYPTLPSLVLVKMGLISPLNFLWNFNMNRMEFLMLRKSEEVHPANCLHRRNNLVIDSYVVLCIQSTLQTLTSQELYFFPVSICW